MLQNKEIVLMLGEWFSLGNQSLNEPSYYRFAGNRALIFRNGRPVGHLTVPDLRPDSKCCLWLQNYAGFNCNDFVYRFDNVSLALLRAKEILTEWDTNPRRPTWIA